MILSFNKQNVEERQFINKIWAGLLSQKICIHEQHREYLKLYKEKFGQIWTGKDSEDGELYGKYHTIRADEKNRWKKLYDIQLAINSRTPNYFQFCPTIPCTGIQTIEIDWDASGRIDIGGDTHRLIKQGQYGRKNEGDLMILIDKKRLPVSEWETLAHSDGFDTLDDFLTYFNQDFKGKIIQWANFKY